MAGVILGLSFIVHQIGSAGGPMLASIAFDLTGSYDGFMKLRSWAVILLLPPWLFYNTVQGKRYRRRCRNQSAIARARAQSRIERKRAHNKDATVGVILARADRSADERQRLPTKY